MLNAIDYSINLVQWIAAVLENNSIPKGEIETVLKDGTILCKLINKIQPGSVKKYKETVNKVQTSNCCHEPKFRELLSC